MSAEGTPPAELVDSAGSELSGATDGCMPGDWWLLGIGILVLVVFADLNIVQNA